MDNTLKVSGKFVIEVIGPNGELKQKVTKHNRVVDTGLAQIASLIVGQAMDPDFIGVPTHCAVGSNSSAVVAADKALRNEIYRNLFDGVTRTKNSVEYKTTFHPAQPNVPNCRIEEVGLFNAPSEGCMLNRCVFQPIWKAKDDTVIITYVITILAVESTHDDKLEDFTPGEQS